MPFTFCQAESISGQEHSPPRSNGDFAAYAGALAVRYGPGGGFWRAHPELTPQPVDTYEIWNEPNLAIEWGLRQPEPQRYVDLLRTAYLAVKAADPSAVVVSAGLAPTTATHGGIEASESPRTNRAAGGSARSSSPAGYSAEPGTTIA